MSGQASIPIRFGQLILCSFEKERASPAIIACVSKDHLLTWSYLVALFPSVEATNQAYDPGRIRREGRGEESSLLFVSVSVSIVCA